MALTSSNNSITINCGSNDADFQGYKVEPGGTPGEYIVTRPDGSTFIITDDEVVTTLVNNNDGTISYTNEDGTLSIVDICALLSFCNIGDLGNVSAAAPLDGQVLTWDAAAGVWLPEDGSSNYVPPTNTVTKDSTSGDEAAATAIRNGLTAENGDLYIWETPCESITWSYVAGSWHKIGGQDAPHTSYADFALSAGILDIAPAPAMDMFGLLPVSLSVTNPSLCRSMALHVVFGSASLLFAGPGGNVDAAYALNPHPQIDGVDLAAPYDANYNNTYAIRNNAVRNATDTPTTEMSITVTLAPGQTMVFSQSLDLYTLTPGGDNVEIQQHQISVVGSTI